MLVTQRLICNRRFRCTEHELKNKINITTRILCINTMSTTFLILLSQLQCRLLYIVEFTFKGCRSSSYNIKKWNSFVCSCTAIKHVRLRCIGPNTEYKCARNTVSARCRHAMHSGSCRVYRKTEKTSWVPHQIIRI